MRGVIKREGREIIIPKAPVPKDHPFPVIPEIPIPIMTTLKVENELISYNKCRRCNRKLTDPTSKLLGYGPDCYKKHLKESRRRLF